MGWGYDQDLLDEKRHITKLDLDKAHSKGAESFQGTKFHSGQWDHNVPYKGKRVGVIGSGCSAAQIVPAIANQVDKLLVQ